MTVLAHVACRHMVARLAHRPGSIVARSARLGRARELAADMAAGAIDPRVGAIEKETELTVVDLGAEIRLTLRERRPARRKQQQNRRQQDWHGAPAG